MRFQPGEGPSRGLLRDYEPSDVIRVELFEALVRARVNCSVLRAGPVIRIPCIYILICCSHGW